MQLLFSTGLKQGFSLHRSPSKNSEQAKILQNSEISKISEFDLDNDDGNGGNEEENELD
jgi:hypothetical protein